MARVRIAFVTLGFLALSAPVLAQRTPDSTYGQGGTKTVDKQTNKDGSTEETITIRDKNGNVREQTKTTVDPKKKEEVNEKQYFDANGTKTRETMVKKDAAGHETYSRVEDYKNGLIDSGDIYEDDATGKTVHKRYNKKTQQYEPVEPPDAPPNPSNPHGPSLNLDVTSTLFIGGAVILEDSTPRFRTTGLAAAYTRLAAPTIGVVGDVSLTFGSSSDTFSTRKIQIVGGVAYLPPSSGDVFFSPHVLAGLAHLTTSYGPSTTSYSGTAFALVAGVDLGTRVTPTMDVQGRADYNATFFGSTMQSDFRFAGGVRFRF